MQQRLEPARRARLSSRCPRPIEFPTVVRAGQRAPARCWRSWPPGRSTAHALYYAPGQPATSPRPTDERPPLIVISHGGPTSATTAALALRDPVLDLARLRRRRRQLRRLQLATAAPTASGSRATGASSTRSTASTPPATSPSAATSTRRASPSAAAAPAGTRRSTRSRATASSPPAPPTSASPTSRRSCSGGTHKFESRYLVGLVGPVSGGGRALPRALAHQPRGRHLAAPSSCSRGWRTPSCRRRQAEIIVEALRAQGPAATRTSPSRASSTAFARPRTSRAASRPSCTSTGGCSGSRRPTRSSRWRSRT